MFQSEEMIINQSLFYYKLAVISFQVGCGKNTLILMQFRAVKWEMYRVERENSEEVISFLENYEKLTVYIYKTLPKTNQTCHSTSFFLFFPKTNVHHRKKNKKHQKTCHIKCATK